MKKTLLIIAGSALVTSLAIKAAPAIAQAPTDTAVSIVRTGDLDLSTPSGRRALGQRLVVAAHAVCDDPSALDLRASNDEAKCRADVIAAARSRAEAVAARNEGEPIRIAIAR